jgi:hypothetical protein
MRTNKRKGTGKDKCEPDGRDNKLRWHPGFLQAMKLELADYRDSLEYTFEYQLTSEPLRIDLLIIKKPKDVVIDKNIARIFRTRNLIEYKSPDDYLGIKDFLKVYAYANLYAAITPRTDFSDLTLTFIESRRPHKLLRYLTNIRGYTVKETSPGIYQVSGDYLPMQIIETKKLSANENLWLKSLVNGLEARYLDVILEEAPKRAHGEDIGAYLGIIIRANPKTFLEVQEMRYPTLEEVFTEAGLIPKWLEQGREQGLEQGRVQGLEQGRVQGLEQGRVQGLEQGLEQGRVQGLEQGIEAKSLEIARKLKKMGLSATQIAEGTDLPAETIEQLE